MRKLAIAMALASTAIASPALARDGAWYIGVEGGAMIVEDLDLDIGAIDDAATVDHDYGYDFDAIIGYDFGAFRLEAEVGYRGADIDGLVSTVGFPVTSGITQPGDFSDIVAGETTALSFMVNGMLDFGDDDGIQGFIGGGAGVARVKTDLAIRTDGDSLDDSDTGFAYQAIAGVRAPLTDNIDVGLKYRFFNVDDVEIVDTAGRDISTRFRSHSLLGSLIFNFGGPEEEVIVPPPPPPADPLPPEPAPQPITCTPGPYIVFFDWDRSEITPEAGGILDQAVSAYQSCGNAQVMLAGHADKSGSDQYNVGLSQRRNDSVRAYLESRGIPSGVISTEAFGESAPRVETADGVRELQNRRVEITYGPGSGM